jgi:hypothetical protein
MVKMVYPIRKIVVLKIRENKEYCSLIRIKYFSKNLIRECFFRRAKIVFFLSTSTVNRNSKTLIPSLIELFMDTFL